jgi:endo-1,4-beta-xylanase
LPFYWRAYEPERGKPQYAETDAALSWCEQHGITAKGHTLAWNLRDPPWLPPDRGEVRQLLFGRVRDCVRQFRGRIDIWDVVNELTEYDRPRKVSDAPLQSEVIREMGPGPYARTAFNTAREANPDAVLIINDYLLGPRFMEVLTKLEEGGRPAYDAIGLQAHQHHGVWPPAKIWNVCDRFERMGRPVHITETTILSGQLQSEGSEPDRWDSTPEGERRQAAEVERFYTVAFSHPAVQAITWWDLTDRGAWKKAPAGLLRKDMTPKPAYDVLMRLIKNKWWTRADKPVNDKGEVHLRGFYGTYKITATTGGRESTGRFSFDKGTSKPIVVRLN